MNKQNKWIFCNKNFGSEESKTDWWWEIPEESKTDWWTGWVNGNKLKMLKGGKMKW